MTSRTFTETGIGNTYQDWVTRTKQLAGDYGCAWLIEGPPGVYRIRASSDYEDAPYSYRAAYYGEQPVPRLGMTTEERLEILEQQVAELQAQLEMRI